jgi:hypothetical protein
LASGQLLRRAEYSLNISFAEKVSNLICRERPADCGGTGRIDHSGRERGG